MRTFRVRLALSFSLAVLLALLVITAALFFVLKAQLSHSLRAELAVEFEASVRALETSGQAAKGGAELLSRRVRFAETAQGLGYAIFGPDGLLAAKSEAFQEDPRPVQDLLKVGPAPSRAIDTELVRPDGLRLFLLTRRVMETTGEFFFVQMSIDDGSIQKTLKAYLLSLFFIVPLFVLLAALGGWYFAGRMLLPVRQLQGEAERLSLAGNLRETLPLAGSGDELDQLATSFNQVLTKLHEAHERIASFTADASHELRLPLAVIKGEAELVLSRERDIAEYQRVLASILEEFDHLTRLTNQLLMLARSDSGVERLEKTCVDLGEMLAKLIEFFGPLAEEKSLGLELDVPSPVELEADRGKLEEMFLNLIDNAIKYTPSGGRVRVLVLKGDATVSVSVADTGIGIASEDKERVFERFFRVDKARSRAEGGSGLGLSIAIEIARAHEGRITLESSLGKGSTFTVILPL